MQKVTVISKGVGNFAVCQGQVQQNEEAPVFRSTLLPPRLPHNFGKIEANGVKEDLVLICCAHSPVLAGGGHVARRPAPTRLILRPRGLRPGHVRHLEAPGQDRVASCILGNRTPVPLRASHS